MHETYENPQYRFTAEELANAERSKITRPLIEAAWAAERMRLNRPLTDAERVGIARRVREEANGKEEAGL